MKQLLFFALTFLTLATHAQTQAGLEVGPSLMTVDNDGANYKARAGFYAGGFLQANLGGKWKLQPALVYSVKGFRSPATQFSGEATVGLHYIALPLLLGYQASPHFLVVFGPEAGYLLSAKSKFDGGTHDLSGIYRKFDVGVDLGFVYQLNQRLGLSVRYNYGFKDLMNVIYTDGNGNIIGQGKAGANRGLQLGLSFSLSK